MNGQVYLKAFLGGFLYIFGLSRNPIKDINKNAKKDADTDRIAGYWKHVGEFLGNAYETTTRN